MKYCKNCIWFDKCGCDAPCKYYEADNTASAQELEAYEQDLELRASVYKGLVDEQDA